MPSHGGRSRSHGWPSDPQQNVVHKRNGQGNQHPKNNSAKPIRRRKKECKKKERTNILIQLLRTITMLHTLCWEYQGVRCTLWQRQRGQFLVGELPVPNKKQRIFCRCGCVWKIQTHGAKKHVKQSHRCLFPNLSPNRSSPHLYYLTTHTISISDSILIMANNEWD